MKMTLEFENTEENYEMDEMKLHIHAKDYIAVLWDLDQHLRSLCKHGDGDVCPCDLRDKLYELMSEHDVSFNYYE